jgi:hypothetical protein
MPGKIITGAFAVIAGLTLAACSLGIHQPKTAAGARAAARSFFSLYATSQWAATYQLLSPAAQHAISEATWAKAQQGCPNQGIQLAGTLKSVTLTGNTAVVRAARFPARPGGSTQSKCSPTPTAAGDTALTIWTSTVGTPLARSWHT